VVEQFRLGVGGPLYRAEQATHLLRLRALIVAAIALSWVPLMLLALAQRLITGHGEPLLRDLSVHVRLLVALPLFLVNERLLDYSCHEAVARIFGEHFIPAVEQARARAALRSAERWRDAAGPEALLLALALASGLAALLGILPPAGVMHGVTDARPSVVRAWYALISLPLFQFLLWRSLFRWALWVRVLATLSRIPLQLVPMHADRRGGIGFLKRPSVLYCAGLLLALSSVLCAGWGTQMLLYGAKIETFKPLLYAFVLVGALIALAPLFAFIPQLLRARQRGRCAYGGLVAEYARQFQARWAKEPPPSELLGNQDFQALNDLCTSYRENSEKMQLFLVDGRDCILLFVVSQLPALPILLTAHPPAEVLRQLLHLVTGISR
jgi:hypothetical protein